MTKVFKGTSPLAVLADRLPVPARIGLAVVAVHLALDHLKDSPNFPFALAAFELARSWYEGKRFDPRQLEDSIASEDDEGAAYCIAEATSEEERSAWNALVSAILYVAFQAYRTLGQYPGALLSEVSDDALDEVDKPLRKILPGFMTIMRKAAEYLKQEPGASFAQLKSRISQPGE